MKGEGRVAFKYYAMAWGMNIFFVPVPAVPGEKILSWSAPTSETEGLVCSEGMQEAEETAFEEPDEIQAVLDQASLSQPPRIRPKQQPARIDAPSPYVYRRDGSGRRVCDKKNDKPSKSKKYDRVHMDMECCLDPDEIPNPHCYYDPQKYGKYLKKFQ